MGELDLRWPAFEYFNINKERAFEDMCRRLFTEEYLKGTIIPHSDHNTPGIEVLPVLEPKRVDGQIRKRISFQAKYHGKVDDAYKKFTEASEATIKYWKGQLDLVYLFCNQTLTTESAKYKKIANILAEGDIEAVPITNTDLLDLLAKYPVIAKDFFPPKGFNQDPPFSFNTIPAAEELIGRENDIQNIQDALAKNRMVSIHAGGGVGKTAIAAVIANGILCRASRYRHVAWITSTGNLVNDLSGLDIPSLTSSESVEEKYKEICRFLQKNPTFLIIDNVDEPFKREEINDLNTISIAGNTKILITGRAIITNGFKYELGDLNIDAALELFYRHFTDENWTIDQIKERADYPFAENIVKAATRNALFIELIGKMAYADHWTLERLWESLCEDVFGLNSKHPVPTAHGDDGKLLEHIKKLYGMSNLSERQKEIMSFIALFPAEHSIFFDVFKWAGFEDDEVDNLGELQKRGWIERGDEGYLIHTMVKGSVEQQQGKGDFDEERYRKLIDKLADTDQYMPVDMVYSKVREHIVVTETICRLLIGNNSKQIRSSNLYHNLAVVYLVRGEYDKALEYYEKALVIREKVLGKDHPSTATTYNNLAGVYNARGEYDKALEYYEKALVIREKVLGKDHPSTATTYNNMASVYYAQGEYDKALGYYKKARVIVEKDLGKDHPSTASTYNNMANVFHAQGEYDKALEYYEKALVIREKVQGKDHPATATTYNNMAGVYEDQEEYDKALEYYEKALVIREKVLGIEHPDTASTYNNLADVYRAQGEYDKALEYCEKSREIQEKALGKNHPSTATTYNNMAFVYRAQGEYGKALEYYGKALVIQEKALGKNHPSTATTYNNMATVYYAQREYGKALEYYGKALVIQEKVLGKKHPETALTYNNIAFVYHTQGEYGKAQEYYERALKIFTARLGEEHPKTKLVRNNMESIKKR